MEEALLARVTGQVTAPASWGYNARDAAPPRVRMLRVSNLIDQGNAAPTGWKEARVQVDCMGSSYGEAITLARNVEAALSGWKSGDIQGVFFVGLRDLQAETDIAEMIPTVSMDFRVSYRNV